jgi:capsular exopolysaccharide synthesis family protein
LTGRFAFLCRAPIRRLCCGSNPSEILAGELPRREPSGEAAISAEPKNLVERERPVREPGGPGADSFGPATPASPSASAALPRDGFLQIVWRQRYVVAGCVVLALVVAGAYLLLATPMYRSDADIYAKPAAGAVVARDDAGRPTGPATINLFREAELITSTPILAHTLNDPSLQNLRTFESVENPFDYLKDHLSVEVGTKEDLLTVSFTSPVKDDAARVVESVVNAYIDFQTKKSRTATDHLLEVLGKERRSLEEAHEAKGAEMVAFKRDRGVLFNEKDRGDINVERVKALSQALTAAQLDTLNARSAYQEAVRPIADDAEKMESVADIQARHGVTPVSAAEEATLRAELFRQQGQLGDMQQHYLSNHPTIRTLQKRVDQLNIAYVAAMERRWHAAEKREAELQATFDEQQKLAIDRSADAVAYARLEQELANKQQQIQAIDKQVRDLNLLEAASAAVEVQVVNPARLPKSAASPQKARTLAVGLVLGLIGGISLACVRDWLDPRLRSADEIKAVLGMPILGMVPRMASNLAPAVRGQKLLLDPGSEAAESYRALRTAIKFGVPDGRAKTILVASPSSGDGKTTVASNLAIALAQAGKRVLLLDADLRHPKQHETFGIENHSGLGDVLAHDLTVAEAVHKTVVANLEILPAGPHPENPADLLNSPRFIDVIDELMDRYDHVVIDSPPVMAVTDSRIMAASCDVTVMVLRADRADRKLCEMARDGLAGVGANLLGLVMNHVPPGAGVYAGDGNYYYGSDNGGGGRPFRSRRDRGGATAGSATSHPDGLGDHDPAPLVALEAMKSLQTRPHS